MDNAKAASQFLRCGHVGEILRAKKDPFYIHNAWSTAQTHATFETSSFLLVNSKFEIFRSNAKFPIARFPIKTTRFHLQKFAEQQ